MTNNLSTTGIDSNQIPENVVNEIMYYQPIKRVKYIVKLKLCKSDNRHFMDGWDNEYYQPYYYKIVDYNEADYINWEYTIAPARLDFEKYTQKINQIRGGRNILNLRAVCKAFNRIDLTQIIQDYDLQFQKGKYTYVLFENLRFKENWFIFPNVKNHPYYVQNVWLDCKRYYEQMGISPKMLNYMFAIPTRPDSKVTYTPFKNERAPYQIPIRPLENDEGIIDFASLYPSMIPTLNPDNCYDNYENVVYGDSESIFIKPRMKILLIGGADVGQIQFLRTPSTESTETTEITKYNDRFDNRNDNRITKRNNKRDSRNSKNINIQKIKKSNYNCNSGSRKSWHR